MNYTSMTRTNRFAVKDPVSFISVLRRMNEGNMHYRRERGPDLREYFTLWFDEYVPDVILKQGATTSTVDDYDDFDLRETLQAHLVPGCIAVLMQGGFEGERYASGYAWAVKGGSDEVVEVYLEQIYEMAKEVLWREGDDEIVQADLFEEGDGWTTIPEEDTCSACGMVLDPDGYDGLCASCADREAQDDDE